MPLTSAEDIAELLQNARTIAMVGASDRPDRPSYGVMKFLQDQGYRVIPVNPHDHRRACPRRICLARAFPDRRADRHRRHLPPDEGAGPIVDQAIEVGAKAVWMQLGRDDEAAAARRSGGLKVVMNHCPKIEFARLGLRQFGKYPLIQPLDSDVMEAELSPAAASGLAGAGCACGESRGRG